MGEVVTSTALVAGVLEDQRLVMASVEEYAIFMLDPVGHVLAWSLGARQIKGYEFHEPCATRAEPCAALPK